MAKREYSSYQQEVIGRYYRNLDAISLQKLQELCTELYLAKDGPKEDKLWERVEKAMTNLKVPKQIMEHINADVMKFIGNTIQQDDMTLIVARIH